MFDDIIQKKPKRLTVDDITWDKNCSNCGHGNESKELINLIFCGKDSAHRHKDYFCYDWKEIDIKIVK